jgi:hypothetical protein
MTENKGTEDFRKSAAFLDELDDGLPPERPRRRRKSVRRAWNQERGLFGMQPGQAFLISAMIFIFVCLAGFAIMMFLEKMTLPF